MAARYVPRCRNRLERGRTVASFPLPERGRRWAAACLGMPFLFSVRAEAAPEAYLGGIDPQNAIGFALTMGLIIFSTVTAILHIRERERWTRRERSLTADVETLQGASDLANLLIGSERQLVVSWAGRHAEPRIEGDPMTVGQSAPRRALAFGSWLAPAQATELETHVQRLKERGEGFHLTLETANHRYVEAEGRTMSGYALLRLRDVTGDRFDLIRARQDLAEARTELTFLRGILDLIAQPVWRRDREGRLVWMNRAYLAAVETGDLDEAKAHGAELLDRPDREEARRKRAAGERFEKRAAAVVAGSRRVLDIVEEPSNDGSVGFALDVSELETVRADLQRQDDAHARTLDQLPSAVAMFDARQRLTFYNAAYRDLWKFDPSFLASSPSDGEILDRLRENRKLPEQADFRSWKNGILSAYRAVEPQETWWHLPDRRTLRVVANPHPQGGLTYLFDDVTERMHLQSQYNALVRVQGETLDTLKEGVAVFGSDGRLRLSNPSFLQMWRFPADAEHPHIDEVIEICRPLYPLDAFWNDLRGAVAGLPEARMGLASRLERRDGSVLDCAVQPLPDGGTLMTLVDVTASVNVERALTEKNEALEKASQLRDDFVHHVSYELRSPLTNIIGFAQLLGDGTVGPLNTKQGEYAGHIMRSSGALLAIVNDILDLATIDNGAMELKRESVDVVQTIEAVMRGLADRFAESGVTLDIQAGREIGSFTADGQRVRQILFNLLSNAVGFSAPGQSVRLSARKAEGEVVFEVEDQGRGIPEDVRERVFERFETHTLGTRHRGVGLGLSIVRSFVELHGGRVTLVSSPGTGTCVTCYFPADGQSRRAAAE